MEWRPEGPPSYALELDCCVRAIMSDRRFNVADFLRRIRETSQARSGNGPSTRRALVAL